MRVYLVIAFRKSTKSILRIHIDAENHSKATKYANNTFDKTWIIQSVKPCLCPSGPYNINESGLIWNIDSKTFILPHGSFVSKEISCTV